MSPFSLCSTGVPPKFTSPIEMPVSDSEGLFEVQGAGAEGTFAGEGLGRLLFIPPLESQAKFDLGFLFHWLSTPAC